MRRLCRLASVPAVALAAAALTGCGFGAGESSEGTATLLVTRDYGSRELLRASAEDPAESDTVMRFLDREADITTRYGGGFVQSIEGLSGAVEGGRSLDWFFYVNGIESPIGSADRTLEADDRVWWDYHDWTDVMRVPAVVGSFPEPFLQEAAGGDRTPVRVLCSGRPAPCDAAADRLADAGVDATIESAPARGESATLPADAGEAPRVLVGPWAALRRDPAAAQLEEGPATSGVFAEFRRRAGRWELVALDTRARVAERMAAPAGLVAAVRAGEDPVTWVVTGTEPRGVEAAADLLREGPLRGRYALAVRGEGPVPVPVVAGEGKSG